MYFIYKFLTTISLPLYIMIVFLRKYLKKEDDLRFKEKFLSNSWIFFSASSKLLIMRFKPSIDSSSNLFLESNSDIFSNLIILVVIFLFVSF